MPLGVSAGPGARPALLAVFYRRVKSSAPSASAPRAVARRSPITTTRSWTACCCWRSASPAPAGGQGPALLQSADRALSPPDRAPSRSSAARTPAPPRWRTRACSRRRAARSRRVGPSSSSPRARASPSRRSSPFAPAPRGSCSAQRRRSAAPSTPPSYRSGSSSTSPAPFAAAGRIFNSPVGVGVSPNPSGLVPDVINYGWREYGMRVGLWRFADVLDAAGVKATVALNSGVCEAHPRRGGDEEARLGIHGARHHQQREPGRLEMEKEKEVIHTFSRRSSKRPDGGRAAGSAPG